MMISFDGDTLVSDPSESDAIFDKDTVVALAPKNKCFRILLRRVIKNKQFYKTICSA